MRPEKSAIEARREVAFGVERAGREKRPVSEQQRRRADGGTAGAGREIDRAGEEDAEGDALEHAGDAEVLPLKGEEAGDVEKEARGRRGAAERITVLRSRASTEAPAVRRPPSESAIETPTVKRKNGKIVSVYVQPCQAACSSGG